MHTLNTLKNTHAKRQNKKRIGRGHGSGWGKTSGRGHKGAGSRSGYKRRLGYEGGQFRLFMKLPIRGFSNARFRKPLDTVNLDQIEEMFNDGETVSEETLREHGFISGQSYGIKVLGNGELTKKVEIEADAFSRSATEKLKKNKIKFSVRNKKDEASN